MGKFLWLIVLLISYQANAASDESESYDFIEKDSATRIQINKSFAKIDFEQEKIIVTATLIQKDKPKEDFLFGGNFSPTATMYLKPLNNSRLKAFIQVRCVDYFCNELALGFGVRTSTSNPYAYNEQKFVILSSDNAMGGM